MKWEISKIVSCPDREIYFPSRAEIGREIQNLKEYLEDLFLSPHMTEGVSLAIKAIKKETKLLQKYFDEYQL